MSAQETGAKRFVVRELRPEQLQRDLPAEPLVRREVHGAHPASAEQRVDRVLAERLADGGGHRSGHVRSR